MNTVDCIKSRRSIRRFKPDSVKHSLIEEIVSAASFSPSWKNTQITRYIAIEDPSLLGKIADDFTILQFRYHPPDTGFDCCHLYQRTVRF